ncbi:MAG: hypothetical protein FD178_214 [Ignavibacteria bacterium]|nr:MAG: hypothetical protein FD178_214 [Ignavibacteria bacterium]
MLLLKIRACYPNLLFKPPAQPFNNLSTKNFIPNEKIGQLDVLPDKEFIIDFNVLNNVVALL